MSEPRRARLHPFPGTMILLLVGPLLTELTRLALMTQPTPLWGTNHEVHYLGPLLLTGIGWLLAVPAYWYLGGWLANVDARTMGLLHPLRAAPLLVNVPAMSCQPAAPRTV